MHHTYIHTYSTSETPENQYLHCVNWYFSSILFSFSFFLFIFIFTQNLFCEPMNICVFMNGLYKWLCKVQRTKWTEYWRKKDRKKTILHESYEENTKHSSLRFPCDTLWRKYHWRVLPKQTFINKQKLIRSDLNVKIEKSWMEKYIENDEGNVFFFTLFKVIV